MRQFRNRLGWALVWLPLAVLPGCGRDADANLRDSYERMMASAERRAAAGDTAIVEPPLAPPIDTMPIAPAAPATLPIDTLPTAQPVPAAQPEPAPEPEAPRPAEGTAGVTQRDAGGGVVTLRAVRTARHEEFDRVVFEFDGGMPGHRIEYVDRPIRECGSGRTVPVAGQGWLRVRLDRVRAHEFVGESARATVTDRNRALDMIVARQLTLTCDFEAQVEWVLGVSAPNRYRVLELREPSRLVVDVMH